MGIPDPETIKLDGTEFQRLAMGMDPSTKS